MATHTKSKCTLGVRRNSSENFSKTHQENSNPNLTSPMKNPSSSPSIIKSSKPHLKNLNTKPVFAPSRNKIKERKFVVAKRNRGKNQELNVEVNTNASCTCSDRIQGKCLCVAYENLRASQESFFKDGSGEIEEFGCEGEKENKPSIGDVENQNGYERNLEKSECKGFSEMGNCESVEVGSPKSSGCSMIKRSWDRITEEGRESVLGPGSGKVLQLVKAFEKILTMPKETDKNDGEDMEEMRKGIKLQKLGWQKRLEAPETEEISSAFCPGELFFTADCLGLGFNVSTSLDCSRGSISSRSSVGSRRGRRSSSLSSGADRGRKWKNSKKQRQRKVTSLRPFQLRTEVRGKAKEEEFFKKLQEMMVEEEKQRIPIAQGLPWTTDEPECLIKPPVKECTQPIDLKLHTDVRAVDRADFDHEVAEKLMLIEQYKMERERQRKLEEEEEIKRLRKELVPKAQPLPYFDKPFVPKRSTKQPTVPKDPKFHIPQHKKIKCCLSSSWKDFNEYVYIQQLETVEK